MMMKIKYTVRFLTPAFLGDAEQSGQWRTPPFKALLRQWWRVVYAADHGFNVNVNEMRREEGILFGNAWLSHRENDREVTDHCKSLVRLRLERWTEGDLKKAQWPQDDQVIHPEVTNRGKSVQVGSGLYLGYGPLTYDNQRHATTLKTNAAIQAGEAAKLSLAWPAQHRNSEVKKILDATIQKRRIERALWLMDRYGTLGGRSRNGWGSVSLLPLPPGEGWGEGNTVPLRPWRDCLDLDWPHAIGRDEKGALIWQTRPFADWKAVMRDLAIIKIGLRTQFVFVLNEAAKGRFIKKDDPEKGISDGAPQDRHWLAYPVTHHPVSRWGNNSRLPNQLRFKVRQDANGKLVGVIFHVPHLPPKEFLPNAATLQAVWEKVHVFLDAPGQQLQRIAV